MTAPSRRALRASSALAAAALGLALATSGCSSVAPAAASVGGTDIDGVHVDEMVAALAEASPDAKTASAGEGEGTYRSGWAADVLQVLIERVTLSRVARERGIVHSADDEKTAEEELAQQLTGPGGEGVGQKALDGMSKETRDWLIDISADEVALRADLLAGASLPAAEGAVPGQATIDPEILQAIYDEQPTQFLSHCYRIAQLAPDDVQEFGTRLQEGEDFGAITADLSTDASLAESQGDAGCTPDLGFAQQPGGAIWEAVQPYLQTGGIAGPVPVTQFAPESQDVLVLEVSAPTQAPFEEISPFLAQDTEGISQFLVRQLLAEELATGDVRVDPRFGRWDDEDLVVVAPVGPSGPTTLPEIVPSTEAPPG